MRPHVLPPSSWPANNAFFLSEQSAGPDFDLVGVDLDAAVANAGISGSDERDMLLEAVEKRFGTYCATEVIEVLTDNGSAYMAKDTRIFARQLGLKLCFTPVASPQSNGMSEAFVKTLKRDYVRINPMPDAETVLKLIGDWIEDDNENRPHSGLKWRAAREFIKAKTETA